MLNVKPVTAAPVFNKYLSGKTQFKSSLEIYTRRVSFLIYRYILFLKVRFFSTLKKSKYRKKFVSRLS